MISQYRREEQKCKHFKSTYSSDNYEFVKTGILQNESVISWNQVLANTRTDVTGRQINTHWMEYSNYTNTSYHPPQTHPVAFCFSPASSAAIGSGQYSKHRKPSRGPTCWLRELLCTLSKPLLSLPLNTGPIQGVLVQGSHFPFPTGKLVKKYTLNTTHTLHE